MSGAAFTTKVAAVVLAAGAYRRMSAIKQLLPWKDTTLLGFVIKQLEQAGAAHIFVVLGAHQKEILKHLDITDVSVIENNDWSKGMGTSIASTITYLKDQQLEYDGLLVTACDQPLISLTHYKKLINSCINSKRIVASSYEGNIGIPAVFAKEYFNELGTLSKDVGAKSVVKKHLNHLIRLDAPEAGIDLDTKQRYEKYYQTYGT